MNAKEWWRRFRLIYRKHGIQRQELIQQSQIEPAQWSRLERGDGSPTDDMIQKIKIHFDIFLQHKTLKSRKRSILTAILGLFSRRTRNGCL